MGMVKSNQNKNVLKCSSTAIAALSTEDPMLAPNEAFPKPSIDAFGPLRGVGVATASLILSIATATGNSKQQVPFYSDDIYLWLCLKEFPEPEDYEEEEEAADEEHNPGAIAEDGKNPPRPPKFKLKRKISKFKRPNGELNVKYNIAEYRKLWDACWELRERLNRAVEAEAETDSDSNATTISHNDIEKTAYVLRNIAVSGYFENQEPEDILRTAARQKARVEAAEKARADASGETAAREKKLAMKKQKKKDKEEMRAKQKEQKALQKKRKIANGGRNVKRRKVE
jgi:ADA HAT complex component 1